MKRSNRLHKSRIIGPLLWIASIQYFIVQIIVALSWEDQFSYLKNTISDLGNTQCGFYGDRFVCSPDHLAMNISFIILGICMLIGSLLIYETVKPTRFNHRAYLFMAISGLGTILVGLFPENSTLRFHELGAGLIFLIGNIAVILIGKGLKSKGMKVYSIITGVVTLSALFLWINHIYLGLGIGGMERIVAYPQTIWLIVTGIYIIKSRYLRELEEVSEM